MLSSCIGLHLVCLAGIEFPDIFKRNWLLKVLCFGHLSGTLQACFAGIEFLDIFKRKWLLKSLLLRYKLFAHNQNMNLTLVKSQTWRAMFSIDLRTLALLRICFALLILYDLITKIPWIKDFYTDDGVLPRAGGLSENNILAGRWSVHFISGEYWFQLLLFVIAGLFAIMLLFGYRTRLATIISWLFLVSLQNRNMLIISGADDLLRLLMFWSIFLPLGARFSVDAALDNNADNLKNDYFSPVTAVLLYARYLCRQWNQNANRAWDRKLQTFEIYYMLENTEFGNLPFDVEKKLFWKHRCY